MLAEATDYVDALKPMVAELQRVHTELDQSRDLFEPDTLCSSSRLTARLLALSTKLKPVVKSLLPIYSGHFHMADTLNASAGAVAGFQTGYAVVTDQQGAVGVYGYLDPALVSTRPSATRSASSSIRKSDSTASTGGGSDSASRAGHRRRSSAAVAMSGSTTDLRLWGRASAARSVSVCFRPDVSVAATHT